MVDFSKLVVDSKAARTAEELLAEERKGWIVWVDLETTGLNPETRQILEVAAVVTDANLNEISSFTHVVALSRSIPLNAFDRVALEMHMKSGLLAEALAEEYNIGGVSARFSSWLSGVLGDTKCPLAGSSVHFDRKFMAKHMSAVESLFGYRNIDVSTIKELVKRWCPELQYIASKKAEHRALADIQGSIEELKWYRALLFNALAPAVAPETSTSDTEGK